MAFGILIFSAIALHLLSLSIKNSPMNEFAIYSNIVIIVIVALVIGMKIYIGLQDITNMIFHHDTLDIEAQRTTIDTDLPPSYSEYALENQISLHFPPSFSECVTTKIPDYPPPSYI